MITIKKIVCTTIALTFVSLVSHAYETGVLQPTKHKVVIDGKQINFETPVYVAEDKMYVSLREAYEKVGCYVDWDEKTSTAIIDTAKNEEKTDTAINKEKGVIPDAETAIAVGKLIWEKYVGKEVEYETDLKVYYLEATLSEAENAWYVTQYFKKNPKVENGWVVIESWATFPYIKLDKTSGQVLEIKAV